MGQKAWIRVISQILKSYFMSYRDVKSKNWPQIWNRDEKLSKKHLVDFESSQKSMVNTREVKVNNQPLITNGSDADVADGY